MAIEKGKRLAPYARNEAEVEKPRFMKIVLRSRQRIAGLLRTFAGWLRTVARSPPVQRVLPTGRKALDAIDARLERERLKADAERAAIEFQYAQIEKLRAETTKLRRESRSLSELQAAQARKLDAETELIVSRTHLERLLRSGKVRLVNDESGNLSLLFEKPLTDAERLVVMGEVDPQD